ncbi:MAG TPA: hypothetical protein VH120_02265, partial [Gemmataceae bacterium]|nr:hypothetical protein [Gemmataceae bacterium]
RSNPKNDFLHESITIYLKMQKTETEEELQILLAEPDRCTDADGKPRLVPRTLAEFRQGPAPSMAGTITQREHPPAP